MNTVCRDCYRPVRVRVKPGKGFICRCRRKRKPRPPKVGDLL